MKALHHLLLLAACTTPLAAQTWSATAPFSNRYQTTADTTRGRLLVFGGRRSAVPVSSVVNQTHWLDDQGYAPATDASSPRPYGFGLHTHDSARGRTVFFGGNLAGGQYVTQTWEHDGTNWQQFATPTSPPSSEGGLAYMPTLGLTIYHSDAGETWVYNGINWGQLAPPNPPPARSSFGFALDPVRQRIVLFGGQAQTGNLDDTWEFDGTNWSQVATPQSPPAGTIQMTFDAVSNRIVARVPFVPDPDWQYDGTSWSQMPMVVTVYPSIPERMVTSPMTGRAMLINHNPQPQQPHTFRELIGQSWVPYQPAIAPTGRTSFALAVDTRRERLLMHGGRQSNLQLPFDELWIREQGQWFEWHPVPAPSRRVDHGFVHDTSRDRTVLFGGDDGTSLHNDTWELANGQWTLRVGAAPSPRARFGMAYDPVHERIVLFGGANAVFLNDTWTLTASGWSPLSPPAPPPARAGASMTYDAANNRMVLFGGVGPGGELGDTWALRDNIWTQIATSGPTARHAAAMAYDPVRGCINLFGGLSGTTTFGDTWQLRANTWTQQASPQQIAPMFGSAMVARPSKQRTELLYGATFGTIFGQAVVSGQVDHWLLEPGPQPQANRHGVGCLGSNGTPSLDPAPGSLPALGSTFSLELQNVATPPNLAWMVLGTSVATTAGASGGIGQLLPADLQPLGLPNCSLWVAPELLAGITTSAGSGAYAIPIPNTPNLSGALLAAQALVLDAGAAGGFATTSNAVVAILR